MRFSKNGSARLMLNRLAILRVNEARACSAANRWPPYLPEVREGKRVAREASEERAEVAGRHKENPHSYRAGLVSVAGLIWL